MLLSVKHILESQKIILASTSPRRKEILQHAGIKFEVVPSLYEEKQLNHSDYNDPSEFVIDTAYHKVMEVANRLKSGDTQPDLIIGADTVVTLDGKVFGKPENPEVALNMLQQLRGKPHTVYTGVVLFRNGKTVKFCDGTKVFFAAVNDSILKKYVETGEPLDKAGSYGIQGLGGSLVEKIEGDYYNVMGLPLHKLCHHIVEQYSSFLEK